MSTVGDLETVRTATVGILDDETAAGVGEAPNEVKLPEGGEPGADGGIAILVVPNRGPAPLDVIAIALGVDAGTDCEWDFWDMTKGSGLSVSHTHWSLGNYTGTLRAKGQTARAAVVVQ